MAGAITEEKALMNSSSLAHFFVDFVLNVVPLVSHV
jgi:hypothetical protein